MDVKANGNHNHTKSAKMLKYFGYEMQNWSLTASGPAAHDTCPLIQRNNPQKTPSTSGKESAAF